MIEAINIILILFILVSGIAAVLVSDLVSAVFLLGAYSFFVAILWGILDAADVSFTEAMVGIGASSIFFLLALFNTTDRAKDPAFTYRPAAGLAICALLAALFIWGSLDLPSFGDPSSPASTYLSPAYLKNSLDHMKTPNVVSAILADYRGFDTLIETTVILSAGIACLLIMRSLRDKAA